MFSLAVPYSAPARGGGGPAALGGRRGGASGVRCFSGFFLIFSFMVSKINVGLKNSRVVLNRR